MPNLGHVRAFPQVKVLFLLTGIKAAKTDLVCFTDDDAIWNANFLKWLLVPFNDDRMGGTGSSQIMRPNDLTKPPTVFERIADMRLSGRMLEACASTYYDGSVSCLSGRTALYHKRILTDNFPQEFTGELWLNKCAAMHYASAGVCRPTMHAHCTQPADPVSMCHWQLEARTL
jgi:hypothetical protein